MGICTAKLEYNENEYQEFMAIANFYLCPAKSLYKSTEKCSIKRIQIYNEFAAIIKKFSDPHGWNFNAFFIPLTSISD